MARVTHTWPCTLLLINSPPEYTMRWISSGFLELWSSEMRLVCLKSFDTQMALESPQLLTMTFENLSNLSTMHTLMVEPISLISDLRSSSLNCRNASSMANEKSRH